MGDIVEKFGENAGKIWRILDKLGSLTQTELMKTTKLNEEEFYTAVGWLARENKICINDTNFLLGECNLSSNIGENAGKVWNLLNSCGDLDVNYIPKLAGVNEKDAYFALGWLAKEGKITGKKVVPKKPQMKFRLR